MCPIKLSGDWHALGRPIGLCSWDIRVAPVCPRRQAQRLPVEQPSTCDSFLFTPAGVRSVLRLQHFTIRAALFVCIADKNWNQPFLYLQSHQAHLLPPPHPMFSLSPPTLGTPVDRDPRLPSPSQAFIWCSINICWLNEWTRVSNLQPIGHGQLRTAMNAAQHKTVNLLKTFFFLLISFC